MNDLLARVAGRLNVGVMFGLVAAGAAALSPWGYTGVDWDLVFRGAGSVECVPHSVSFTENAEWWPAVYLLGIGIASGASLVRSKTRLNWLVFGAGLATVALVVGLVVLRIETFRPMVLSRCSFEGEIGGWLAAASIVLITMSAVVSESAREASWKRAASNRYGIPDQYAIIRDAVCAIAQYDPDLAGERNAGFKRSHSEFGNSIASKSWVDWSPNMLEVAYQMLRNYRKHLLLRYGFDYEAFPDPAQMTVLPPASAAGTQNLPRICTRGTGGYALAWSMRDTHFGQIREKVKSEAGAKWDPTKYQWFVADDGRLDVLKTIVDDWGFVMEPADIADLDQRLVKNHAALVAAREQQAEEAARQTE